MPQKLKHLKITSVDLCPQGANPDAYIQLCKSMDPPDSPPGEGFFNRFLSAIGKLMGKTQEEIEGVAKDASLFSATAASVRNRRVCDEIWDYMYAIRESLDSILTDPDISSEERQAMMSQSVTQFTGAIMAAIPTWAGGNPVGKSSKPPTVSATKSENGEVLDMEFEKSKMSPEDLAALEVLEKKYGAAATSPAPPPAAPALPDTAPETVNTTKSDAPPQDNAELKKALDQLDALNKRLRTGEMEKFAEKYAPLGENPAELAKTLMAMQDAGQETYDAFVKRLDDSLALVEKTGLFKEIGSSQSGGAVSALSKIESAVKELQKANPALSHAEAFVKVCEDNPTLAREYEQSR